ncbi:ModD protein [Anaerovorax odorimutans]|uniref:ModD protein n=1 Tax=Anaerovorax odorimutans TaxID=109327 RepID=UPI000411981C|nr:ModD protein [Anaerovorax odorimutans]
MIYISDEDIDRLIKEDVPYIDLTTWVLGFGEEIGRSIYFTRQDAVLCGTEEVIRIMNKLNIEVEASKPSGSLIKSGENFLTAKGKAKDLHMAWKMCQNIFDHCSGMATKTKELVDIVKSENPNMEIVTTRKCFPGTKALAVKAIMTGGAYPHRLGLSETVLVFKQHTNFIGGFEGFIKEIPNIKHKLCEKKLIVEATSIDEAAKLCEAGVDGIQFDKLTHEVLKEGVPKLRNISPNVLILAAGGINEKNAKEYAKTGVNAIVTTSLYQAKPIDIGVKIEKI